MYSCKEGICCPLSVVTAQNLHRIWGRVMRKQEILWGMLPKVYPSSGRKEKPRLAAADVIAVLIEVVWVRVPAFTWAAFISFEAGQAQGRTIINELKAEIGRAHV